MTFCPFQGWGGEEKEAALPDTTLWQSWVPGHKVWGFPFISFVQPAFLGLGALWESLGDRSLQSWFGALQGLHLHRQHWLVLRWTAMAAGLSGSPRSTSAVCVQSSSWAFESSQQYAFQVLCVWKCGYSTHLYIVTHPYRFL